MINLLLTVDTEKLTLTKLPFTAQKYLTIPTSSIISVNKRQIDKNDIHKFTIFYQLDKNKNEIKEIKLKAGSRSEMNNWLTNLNSLITKQNYQFKIGKSYKPCETFSNKLLNKDVKQLYFYISILEFIINERYMITFIKNIKSYVKTNTKTHGNHLSNNNSTFVENSFRSDQSSLNLNKQ